MNKLKKEGKKGGNKQRYKSRGVKPKIDAFINLLSRNKRSNSFFVWNDRTKFNGLMDEILNAK